MVAVILCDLCGNPLRKVRGRARGRCIACQDSVRKNKKIHYVAKEKFGVNLIGEAS